MPEVSRITYVWVDGKCIEKSEAHEARQRGPYIQSDNLTPMRHPITGKLMDSKSQFRAITRAHGCVEVGNEQQRDTRRIDMPDLKSDIARSIQELGG